MIKIYDNGQVIEEIEDKNVDWKSDATWGGAWIGSERLLGWASIEDGRRVPICTDGNETYGSLDNPQNFIEN